MATEVKRRRGTTVEHSTFTGAIAELTVDLTKDTVVVHDGATQGGFPLLREDFSNAVFTVPDARYLLESNNLSDLDSASTARDNLELGASDDVTFNTVTADLVGDVTGNLTGNVTGNVTGDVTGDLTGAIHVQGKNDSGGTLTKGTPVYISGQSGNGQQFTISAADSDGSGTMPAIGVLAENVNNNAEGDIVTHGKLIGIDTSSFTVGDELFIGSGGTLVNTPPTGEANLLQKIAKVVRVHASSGQIYIMGAGRTNAVPNLDEGDIFIGDSNNQAITKALSDTAVINELESDVIENHLEIESLQDNKVEKGQLFPDGDEQALGTGDAVTFSTVNTGQGDNELYAMNQNVRTTDAVTFSTVDTGQGANELYAMNQDVQTTDAVTFNGLTANGAADLNSTLNVQGVLTTQDNILDDGFSEGWSGTNWRIKADGSAELEELRVRGALRVYEFIAKQISTIGGSEILSIANGRVESVDNVSSPKTITIDNVGSPATSFQAGDLWIIQEVDINSGSVTSVYGEVDAVVSGNVLQVTVTSGDLSQVEQGNIIVAYGHIGDSARQNVMYRNVDASEDNLIMRLQTGITDFSELQDVNNTRVAFGDLNGYSGLSSQTFGFFAGENANEHVLITDTGIFFKDGSAVGAQLTANEFKIGDANNNLSFNTDTGAFNIKIGDEDDLSASVAELRQDLIDIYLADQSTFAGIQFLSGQITLKVGADGKVASARLDATGDESAITLRADFFDFQSNDIVILGDPDQDAGTEAKIALGSNVDTITVANTDSGFIASGAGEFKGYIDANNYLRLNSSGLDIKAETFDLEAGDLRIDSADREIQIADNTTRKVTINDDTSFSTVQTLGSNSGTVTIADLDSTDNTVEDVTPVINVSTYKGDRIEYEVTIDYTQSSAGTNNTLVAVNVELVTEGGIDTYLEETTLFHRFTSSGNDSVTLTGSFKTQTNDLNPASGYGYRLRFYADEGGTREGNVDFDYSITIYNQETQINKGGFISQSSPTNFISDEKIAGNFELDLPIVSGLTFADLFPYRGKVVKYQEVSNVTGTNAITGGSVTIKPYQIIQLDYTEV